MHTLLPLFACVLVFSSQIRTSLNQVVGADDCPVENCNICQTNTKCSQCDQSFYVDTSGVCQECVTDCQICTNGSTCVVCKPEIRRTSEEKCLAPEDGCLPRCVKCLDSDKGHCLICEYGYRVVDGKCEQEGQIDEDESQCSIEFCVGCHHSGKCLFCDFTHQLNLSTGKCDSLNGNCLPYCEQCGGVVCLECIDGFKIHDNYCVPNCNIDGCFICTVDSPDRCIECSKGFYHESPTECKACPKGCQFCTREDECQSCLPGYAKNSKNECVPTCDIDHCADCLGENCATCDSGYRLEGGKCYGACEIDHCDVCSGTLCKTCEEGFEGANGDEPSNECVKTKYDVFDIQAFDNFDMATAYMVWGFFVHIFLYVVFLIWGKRKDDRCFGQFNSQFLFNLYQMAYFEKLNKRESMRISSQPYIQSPLNGTMARSKTADFEAYHLRMSGLNPHPSYKSSPNEHGFNSRSKGKSMASNVDSEFPSSEEWSDEDWDHFEEGYDLEEEDEEGYCSDPTSSMSVHEDDYDKGDFDHADPLPREEDDENPRKGSTTRPKQTKTRAMRAAFKKKRLRSRDKFGGSAPKMTKGAFNFGQQHLDRGQSYEYGSEVEDASPMKYPRNKYFPDREWLNEIDEADHSIHENETSFQKSSPSDTRPRLKKSILSNHHTPGQTTSFRVARQHHPRFKNSPEYRHNHTHGINSTPSGEDSVNEDRSGGLVLRRSTEVPSNKTTAVPTIITPNGTKQSEKHKVAIGRRENGLSVAINPEPPKLCDYIKSDFKERHTTISIIYRDDLLSPRTTRITVAFFQIFYIIIVVAVLMGLFTRELNGVFYVVNGLLASWILIPLMYIVVWTFRFPFKELKLLAHEDFGHKALVVERLQSKRESRFWKAVLVNGVVILVGLYYVLQYIITFSEGKNVEIMLEAHFVILLDQFAWEIIPALVALECLHVEYKNQEPNWKSNFARKLRFTLEILRDFRSIQT